MRSFSVAVAGVLWLFLVACPPGGAEDGQGASLPESGQIREKELNLLYDTGRQFFRQKKYYGARSVFQDIQKARPGYRLVPQYLSVIERRLSGESEKSAAKETARLKALYEEGRVLLRNGDYPAARERFLAVAALDPSFANVEGCLEDVEKAAQSAPARGETPASTSGKPIKEEKPSPAAVPPETKPSAEQAEANDLLDQAYLLKDAGKVEEALRLVDRARRLDPENPRAKRYWAELQPKASEAPAQKQASVTTLEKQADRAFREGNLDKAKSIYTEILQRDPNNRVARTMVAVIDKRIGERQAAPSSKIDPRSRQVLLSRARDALALGRYREAEGFASAVLAESPGDAEARRILDQAQLRVARKDHRAEVTDRKQAEHVEAREQLGQVRELRRLIDQKKYDEVVTRTEALLQARPNWPEVKAIQEAAQEAVKAEEDRANRLKGKLQDIEALMEVERASASPQEPPPIPRPQILVHPSPLEAKTIKQKLQQKVSVNLVDADLGYVLDLLFRATGVNIVANPAMLANQTITIHVEQIALEDLLQYIGRNYGILFTSSRNSVWVSTPDQPFLETQIRHLKRGLTDVTEEAESTSSDVEKLMERMPELIEWPAGSTYYLDRKKNVLFLRSTPEALKKANGLIDEVDADPLQILIETRFVEVESDSFKDFNIDFNMTSDFGVIKKHGGNRVQVDAGSGSDLGPGVSGMRPSDEPAPAFSGIDFVVSGVLTDPQFQVVIAALEDSKKSKTLACPRILAMNNYTSTIEIVQDLVYIENYEVDRADISGTTVGVTPGETEPGTGELSSEPIILPQFATGEEVGFILKVTPSVGLDHRQITLFLEPEIREQVGEVSFQLIIPDLSPERQQDLAPIMRPIISTRKVTTKATIEDGSVLVCAGLMRQRRAQRTSKVPVLGDLPLLGILFRRDGSSDIRTNLMIFVKATILDGRGRRYSDALAPTVIGAGAAETGPDDAAAAEGTAVLAPDTAEPE